MYEYTAVIMNVEINFSFFDAFWLDSQRLDEFDEDSI